MSLNRSLKSLMVAAGLVALAATPAHGQGRGIELGTSLANVTFGLEDGDAKVLGIPSGGFGILNPGLYASIFLTDRIAVEPQFGLILINSDISGTQHILNFNAQVDYFMRGTSANSLYLFGGGGVINVSDAGTTPASISGGAGYRWVLGDRLTMRADGRFTHFTDAGGNAIAFTLSLGGLFGR